MTTELNGPGPIAGEYKGGSSDNLNEQSDNSTPGGSNNGNSGNHDSNTAPLSAADKQIAAVKSDPKVRQRLADLIKGAKAINPNAHLFTSELSQSGMLTIGIDGLTVDQTSHLVCVELLPSLALMALIPLAVLIPDIKSGISIARRAAIMAVQKIWLKTRRHLQPTPLSCRGISPKDSGLIMKES